jgi:hypothetical protein
VSSGQVVSGALVLNGGRYVSYGGIASATIVSGVIDYYGTISGRAA